MKMIQRLTALLLAMMLLLLLQPAPVLAEDSGEAFGAADEFIAAPETDAQETAPADDMEFFLPIDELFTTTAAEPDAAPTEAPTEAPADVTEAPAITEAPAVTEAPIVTEAPAITEAPAVTEAPAITEAPVVTEAPAPTDAPAADALEEQVEKAAFVPGLARISGGVRLYEHKGLWGAYMEAAAGGVVYAAEQSADEKAVRITLNSGVSLWDGWVSTDSISMLSDEQTAAYDAKELTGEEAAQARTCRGHALMPIRLISSTPTATPEPVEDSDVFVDFVPLMTPEAEPAATPESTPAPADDADETDEFEESFSEYAPEATAEPLEAPSIAPEHSQEISKFVKYRALEAPSNLSASHNRNGLMTLTWQGVADAEAYQVLCKAAWQSEYSVLATVSGTSYQTDDLDPSVVYYFRVQAVTLDNSGNVLAASPHSASYPYIVLGDAKIDDPRGKDTSTIRLTWSAVPGATHYDVMMSVHGANDWSIVRTDLTGALCDIKDISYDETYDFRVIPKRVLNNGTVITGNSSRVIMVGSPMETPSFTDYTWTETGMQLTWDAIPGASGYVIYRRAFSETDVTKYIKLVVLDEPVTTYVDTAMDPGEVYYYFVYSFKTCQPEGWRCFSLKGEIGMGVWMPAATGIQCADITNQGVYLSWPKVPGASHYDVYISRSPSTTAPTGNGNGRTSSNSGYHNNAELGRTYYYRVRPVRIFSNGDVSLGPWSDEVTHTYRESTPTYRALLIGNTYPGATNYLPGCDNDSQAMAKMLSRMTATPYTVSVRNNLSDSGMVNAIRSTFADAQPNDVSLFYFSGHGANAVGTNFHGALVGLYNTYMSVNRLKEELDAIPGKKIVIIDSCHSGAMIGKSTGGVTNAELSAFNSKVISAFASSPATVVKAETLVFDGEEHFSQEPVYITRGDNDLANSGYYVITASHSQEESVSSGIDTTGDGRIDRFFGLFTYGLTYGSGWNVAQQKALSSLAADRDSNGEITLYEAYLYARTVALSHNPNQTAQIYPANSAFVIWAK